MSESRRRNSRERDDRAPLSPQNNPFASYIGQPPPPTERQPSPRRRPHSPSLESGQ